MSSFKSLKYGDKIAIVAPSGIVAKSDYIKAQKYLLSLGFKLKAPKKLLAPHMHFANTDTKRLLFLQEAILDPSVKAIWALRGGSGAQRLLPGLVSMSKPKTAKIFIGLSDVSILHHFFNFKWKWPSLHAPILKRMGSLEQNSKEHKMIWDSLNGNLSEQVFSQLKPLNTLATKMTKIQSKVVGGNLTTLQASLGSKMSFQVKDSILFLEDVTEATYRIDRALVSLSQAGVFKSAKAIVLGDFTDCNGSPNLHKELQFFADNINIPVLRGVKSGHGTIQLPIWFGSKAVLENNQLRVQCPIK